MGKRKIKIYEYTSKENGVNINLLYSSRCTVMRLETSKQYTFFLVNILVTDGGC